MIPSVASPLVLPILTPAKEDAGKEVDSSDLDSSDTEPELCDLCSGSESSICLSSSDDYAELSCETPDIL